LTAEVEGAELDGGRHLSGQWAVGQVEDDGEVGPALSLDAGLVVFV